MARRGKETAWPYVKTKREGDGWTSMVVCPSRILGRLKVTFGDIATETKYARDGDQFSSLNEPTMAEWFSLTEKREQLIIKEWKL